MQLIADTNSLHTITSHVLHFYSSAATWLPTSAVPWHSLHFADASCELYFPFEQSVHASDSAPLYWPTPHAPQLVLLVLYWPARHDLQNAWLVASWNLPLGHGSQDDARERVFCSNLPTVHTMQLSFATPSWCWPAAQSIQLVSDSDPSVETYVPAGQRLQSDMPVFPVSLR